jgi:dihydrofolate reductase
MGKVVLGMTISLDGYVQDAAGSVGRLYADFEAMHETASLQDAIHNTGAVIMGRRAFAMGEPDAYADTYEFQVPIFVLTHYPPETMPKQNDQLRFHFVDTGIESAMALAQAAAGEKDVTIIGGANVAQQYLRCGLVDELHIDIMPLLLGDGLRLFEPGSPALELERQNVEQSPSGRTNLIFRIVK